VARVEAVQAFGGVVWERDDSGILRIVVVHRPRYDDWSLPKGKVDAGETPEQTALREVEEETGIVCKVGPFLMEISYPLDDGRIKKVGFYDMRPVSKQERLPDAEIDQVLWWTLDEANSRLSHSYDKEVLSRFAEMIQGSS
jgi:8-oxo-dGTP pyrophosphatase MutT (NUDIX family)